MNKPCDTPSNFDLTPDQVSEVLDNFSAVIIKAKTEFKDYLDLLPSQSGRALTEATKWGTALDDFLTNEKPRMITEIEHLHEDALAHLISHYCAVDPRFLKKIVKLTPKEPNPRLEVLTPERLEHYEAVSTITGDFLGSLGRPSASESARQYGSMDLGG